MAVKFVLNRSGVRELLRSQEMMDVIRDYAQQVADRAGDGYGLSEYVGRNRVNVSIGAETKEASQDNYDNNTLLKALGG